MKIAGGELIKIQGKELDIDMQIVCKLSRFNPKIENYKPTKARKIFAQSMAILMQSPNALPKVETTVIGGLGDSFKIRIYNSDPTRDKHPIIVYLHGGGHVVGDIDTYDNICRYLAHRTPCMVFSVDYRRAPEFPFPTPLEDCYRAYQWVKNNAYRLGGNPEKIAIVGDSAGGNLALATSLKLKNEGQILPNFLGLIYPVAEMSREYPSYQTFSDGFLLTRNLLRWFRSNYCSKESDRLNPLASPLQADNFVGFPNCYVSTAGFDPLSDEDKELVQKLSKSGVKVTYSDFPGMVHGYFNMGDFIPSAREAVDDLLKFIKTEWST
ncbi:alpha/beta hydrolase [Leptospira sp. GIMC2001]|uniref:alpha/beta hydrolase n=1 Tax=Leptospira sp. GIMC2001 TaxID=1513297 RepID=UPI00234BAB60|nr:alpha/beta hydrolase [Leptospira sp. GIMC2001]WCL49286.1 alpha/beta hydrolase [Leptospira sp. GIMC2001]